MDNVGNGVMAGHMPLWLDLCQTVIAILLLYAVFEVNETTIKGRV